MDNEIYVSKVKYSLGDKFRKRHVLGYAWMEVTGVSYGVIEPIYTLTVRPFNTVSIECGEAELEEEYEQMKAVKQFK